jgi:hypothetical protein
MTTIKVATCMSAAMCLEKGFSLFGWGGVLVASAILLLTIAYKGLPNARQ